jgi:hypothetical protein
MMFVPNRKHTYGFHGMLRDSFTFSYVDDIRTSQQTQLLSPWRVKGINLLLLYVDHVHT